MSADVTFLACLRLDQVPNLLLNMDAYQESTCDFCGAPIWLPSKALIVVRCGEAGKACTPCIGVRLRLCREILTRVLRDQSAPAPDIGHGAL